MSRIKVYDVDAFVKSYHPEYKPFRYEKVAIFEGLHGVVFAEEEAVHQKKRALSDEVVVPLCKRPEPGHIAIFACAEMKVSLDEIVAGAPYEERAMEEFFNRRDYNPRCQDNYATLMSSLRDIGFDLHGYFETKQPLDEQVKDAAAAKENSAREAEVPSRDEVR